MRETRDRPEHLLAAYVDGIGELAPTERQAVDAWLRASPAAAEAAEATRALVGKLRALPGDAEPAWADLERSIRDAVDALPPPRRALWRRVGTRWAMPFVAFTMATAALMLWFRHPGDVTTPAAPPKAAIVNHAASTPAHAPAVATPAVALPSAVWLDGSAVDLEGIDDPMAVIDVVGDDLLADPMATATPGDVEGNAGLLPSTDLGWIDDLDTTSIDRLDGFLKQRTKG